MKLSRRGVALGGLLAGLAGYLGFEWYTDPKRQILRLIGEEFGSDMAAGPGADAFAHDLAEYMDVNDIRKAERTEVILIFLKKTNVIRALETQDTLVFLGLYDTALDAPCQNTLSAGWL